MRPRRRAARRRAGRQPCMRDRWCKRVCQRRNAGGQIGRRQGAPPCPRPCRGSRARWRRRRRDPAEPPSPPPSRRTARSAPVVVGRRCHVGSVATVCHGPRCRPASRCRAQGKGTSANAQERSWGESARGAHGVVARLDQVLALRRRLQADARAHELLQLFKVGGRLAEGRRVGLIDQLAAAVACRPVAARVGVEGGSQRGRSV